MAERALSERTGTSWDVDFDRHCAQIIERLCDPAAARADRDARWRELITSIGPHLETWAKHSFVLRRYELATEDDARTVLVAALGRLHADDFANLRTYLSRRPPGSERDRIETDALARLARLSAAEGEEPAR